MTGYGKGEASFANRKFTVEIRSLNSKQLDLTVKLPSRYRAYEYEVRNLASKALLRGKVDVFVMCETIAGSTPMAAVNAGNFADYFRQLGALGIANWGTPEVDAAALQSILAMPEVVASESAAIPDEEFKALSDAIYIALGSLDAFRMQEGAILIADLLGRVDRIMQLRDAVVPYESGRAEIVRNRIRESIASLGITVDTNRLEQEMIYYIEKLDITEEKVRLANHCAYFREVAAGEEGVGRKLGFIAQEMGREINTLGSKASDASIQKIVVEMKDELEKIKEQVLNIL